MMLSKQLKVQRRLSATVQETDLVMKATQEKMYADLGVQLVRHLQEEGIPAIVLVTAYEEPNLEDLKSRSVILTLEAHLEYFRTPEMASLQRARVRRSGWLWRTWCRLRGRAP